MLMTATKYTRPYIIAIILNIKYLTLSIQSKINISAFGCLLGPKMAFKISQIAYKTSTMVSHGLRTALRTSKMAHKTANKCLQAQDYLR